MANPRIPATNAALKNLRQAKGLTQAELAAETGLAEGTISDYECGDPALPKPRLDEMMGSIDIAPELTSCTVSGKRR
ncbi:MAG: helix-turn-helix transcriptional regulator [Acidobacteriota bacterium]